MKNPPTIEQTKTIYQSVFGEECPDPTKILNDYIRFRDIFDQIDMSRYEYIVHIETLPDYLRDKKRQIDQERAMDEWQQKLASMPPKERFMHSEGYIKAHNFALQKSLDETEEGEAIYQSVLSVGFGTDPQDIEKQILEFACKHVLECKKEFLPNFLKSKQGEKLTGWFQGIMHDGERALRTIHCCINAYVDYCEEQWEFHYAMGTTK